MSDVNKMAARALYDAIWKDKDAAKACELLNNFPKLLNAVIDESLDESEKLPRKLPVPFYTARLIKV